MKQGIFIIYTLLLLGVQGSLAQVVTTAASSLRISSDPAAMGMGGTGIATSPDVNGVYWNSARLPFAEAKGAFMANYSPWMRAWSNDMYLASVGGYYKLNENGVVHGFVNYFNPGELEFSDNSGNALQSYHPNEFYISGGYAMKLSSRLGLGIGFKYIHSNLGGHAYSGDGFKPADAFATDLGFYYDARNESKEGWSFGAALTNLGGKVSYGNGQTYFLPANLGLGASYTRVFDEQNKLSFALDLNKLLVPAPPASGDVAAITAYRQKSVTGSWLSSFSDGSSQLKSFQVSLGAEYWYDDLLALRAGYFYEDRSHGDRNYLTTGAALRYKVFTVNIAYLIATGQSLGKSPLDKTFQLGLHIRFTK